jgi:hypothetical protein
MTAVGSASRCSARCSTSSGARSAESPSTSLMRAVAGEANVALGLVNYYFEDKTSPSII